MITKDESKPKMFPFMYKKHPWRVLAVIIGKSYVDGSFRKKSQTWMNRRFKYKLVLTYNFNNGGDDIIISI